MESYERDLKAPTTYEDYVMLAIDFFTGNTLKLVKQRLKAASSKSEIALENCFKQCIIDYL